MGRIEFNGGEREIGERPGAFVIAEAGVNHNGDIDLGLKLVDAAARAGADAVKFQTFRASRLVAPSAPKARYQVASGPEGESQSQMLEKLELDYAQHVTLRDHAHARGLVFLSSPFDEESVDLLVKLGVAAIKLGSGELTNLPLLDHVAATKLPLILSTGMSYLSEVDLAVRRVREAGCVGLALMHCVSLYPTPEELVNLRAMTTLKNVFPDVPVGFSDHTPGVAMSVAAVARGAVCIEKHLTLDQRLPGPDHAASLEPEAFAQMVAMIREVEAGLGHGRKEPMAGEEEMRQVARRSLHVAHDLEEGHVIRREDLAVWRPASGLDARHLEDVIGMRTSRALRGGEALTWAAIHG